MRRHAALPLAACLAALAGCGSGSTRTVSVSSSPPAAGASDTTTTTSRPAKTTSGSGATKTPAPPAQAGGAAAPSGGGGSSGPAFVTQGAGASASGLDGALAILRRHGYSALDPGQYRSGQTLKVLVGARTGSADQRAQQAFFFVNGHYLGTDTSQPSAEIRVAGQGDTEVTLTYGLYRSHDPLCCPTGGQAQVRYALDNGRLVAQDPIPPAAATAAAAGRE